MKRAWLLLASCLLLCAPAAPARAQSAGDGLCAPAARLAAGQVVTDSTAGGEARMDAYPGVGGDFAGPERVYLVQPALGEWHTAQVAAPGAGVRLVLLEEREEDRCRAADAVQGAAGSLSFLPRPGASYYLVVDGPAAADFTLALDCPGCASPRPWMAALAPETALAPSPGPMTFVALGGGFAPGATARLDGDALETRRLADDRLEFDVPAARMARAGTHGLTIDNPGAAGRESAPRALRVEEPPGSCAAALDLVTGRPDERSTAAPGSSARFDEYPGVDGSFPGAEMIYRVWNEAGGITTARAVAAPGNAGVKPSVPACLAADGQPVLFVIGTLGDDCSPTHLTAWGDGSVTWDAIYGVTYYVVVESSTPAPVRYHLELQTNLRWPDEGILVTSAHPRFDWPEVPGASHYVLSLSRYVDGHAPFLAYTSIEPHLTVPASLSGILFWTVTAYAGTQDLGSLPVFAVRVYPVTVPALLSPANGARLAPGGVTLRWSAARVPRTATLLEYEVQVARDADFSPPVTRELSAGPRSRPSLTISDLPGGARYYWRVRAVGSDGPGEWSAGRSFVTPPPAPALVAPADGLRLLQRRAFLAWDAVAGAGGYVVQVSASAGFRRLQAERALRGDHVEIDLPAGTWYWRARVNDPAAPWSAVRSLSVP